jgi:hypothetical protein
MKLGRVIIVTNAMEPWVETSCRNFLPALVPVIAQIPVVYARSVFGSIANRDPLGRNCRDTQFGNQPYFQSLFAAPASNPDVGVIPLLPRRTLPGFGTSISRNRLPGTKEYSAMDELAPQKWKEFAFEREIAGFYSRYERQSWKNVICIGDSIFERDAARQVVGNRPMADKECRIKTAKFLDEPGITELIAELRILHHTLGQLVQHDGSVDLEIDGEDLMNADNLSLAEKLVV